MVRRVVGSMPFDGSIELILVPSKDGDFPAFGMMHILRIYFSLPIP